MRSVVENTIANKGKDDRNFLELLNGQRRMTTIDNLLGKDLDTILGQEDKEKAQKDLTNVMEQFANDLGLDLKVLYANTANLPREFQGSTGSAFVNTEKKQASIVINTDQVKNTSELVGTMMEEFSHILDSVAGRQDQGVAQNPSSGEKGLESLGKPANTYFKEKYADSAKDIQLASNATNLKETDLGAHVGDSIFGAALIPLYLALSDPLLPEKVASAITTLLLLEEKPTEEEINKKLEELKSLKTKNQESTKQMDDNGGFGGDQNNNDNEEKDNFNKLSEHEKEVFEKYDKKGWKGQYGKDGPSYAGGEFQNNGAYGGQVLPKKDTSNQ